MRLWSPCHGTCKSSIHPSTHTTCPSNFNDSSKLSAWYVEALLFIFPVAWMSQNRTQTDRRLSGVLIMARRSGTSIFDGCNAAARREGYDAGHDLRHVYVSSLVSSTTSLSPAYEAIMRRCAALRKDDCWTTAHPTFDSASVEPFVRRA